MSHLGGVRNFLLEKGDKPERGDEGGDVEMGVGWGGVAIFLQFNLINYVCGGKVRLIA